MTIDWTQTLIGSCMAGESAGRENAAVARLARFVGACAALVATGVVIALLPLRGGAATRADLPLLAALLAGNIGGFLLLLGSFRHGRALAAAMPGVAALLSLLLGAGAAGAALVVLAAAIDFRLHAMPRGAIGGPAELPFAVPALISAAALACLAAGASPAAGLVALAPLVASGLARRHARRQSEASAGAAAVKLAAMLAAAAREARWQPFVTDVVGRIERMPGFSGDLAATRFPEGSVTEATLIADRVLLLNALSRAVHEGATSETLTLRMRREPAGAGFPAPPLFEPIACRVHPVPGAAGSAIVVIEADRAVPDQVEAAIPAIDGTVLARAMHDGVAPFNAGLGFLDMIADPRHAPRDLSTYRDFAAEASKAVAEGFRHSMLVGAMLRYHAAGATTREREAVLPARLVSDYLRALRLRDAVDRGEIRVRGAEALPAATIDPAATQLALGALLRFGLRAARCEVTFRVEAGDLVVSCRQSGSDVCPEADSMQQAIEACIAGAGIDFASADETERHARFHAAFAGAVPAIRLAS